MKVFILGGGPAGLAIADDLSQEKGTKFCVIERDEVLGGLAKTIPWKNYGWHDLGPHKIFSLDQNLIQRVEGLLNQSDWLTAEKKSRIFMSGHYLPYPPSPFSLINVFGPLKFSQMVKDYAVAQVLHNLSFREPKTFKDDVVSRVGAGLYYGLFEPIARKLWGDPAELDSKLSKGRVQTPSPVEVLLRLLKLKGSSEFEALTFRYPKGGLRKLWEAIEAKNPRNFLKGTEVTEIQHDAGVVQKLVVKAGGKLEEFELTKNDLIFSTLPITLLPKLFSPKLPEKVVGNIVESCQLNDLFLVFLKIKEEKLIDDSWVFIPSPDVIFHRLSEQKSFDRSMTPNGSIVCCEVMSHKGRDMNQLSDVELKNKCLDGLAVMGIKHSGIEDFKVIRIPKSYPVFRPGYEQKLTSVISYFDGFRNFKTIGRQGSFNYIGTMDAMDIGYGAAKWLRQRDNGESETWNQERQRTEHYPVLD